MRRAGQLQSQTEKRIASPHERVKSCMLLLPPLYSHRWERRTLHASRSRKEQRQQRRRRLQPNWNDVLFFSLSFGASFDRPCCEHARVSVKIREGEKNEKIRELHHQRRQTRTTSTATIRVGAGRVLCRTNESSMAPGGFPAARSLLFVPFHAHLSRSYRPIAEPFLCLSLSPSDTRLVYGSFDFVSQQAPTTLSLVMGIWIVAS